MSLSTLQSKAARRRGAEVGQKGAPVAARVDRKAVSTTQNSSVSKLNGFVTDRTADQMELEIIQVDSLQPRTRKRVSYMHTYVHPFNGPFSGTSQVSRYQKGKTNLDFTEARDSEWQWHQLGHMQVCTWLQTDNHTSTRPLSFLQAGCPSCRPTNSIKALKATCSSREIHISVSVQFISHKMQQDKRDR